MNRPFPCIVTKARVFTWCVIGGLGVTTTTLAQAQNVDDFGSYRTDSLKSRRESSRDFTLELRFGPYLPRVDSEFSNGATPFKDYFGSGDRFMAGTEFDWLPLTIPDVLRFGIGAGLSYTSTSAKSLLAANHDVKSAQDTKFRVMPHWLTSVVRIDVLNRQTPIPLVFVGKLGLANGLWWVDDNPSANRAGGIQGHGMSYGVYYAGGLQLDLGVLDPVRAKGLDNNTGINSVYFYGEFYGMELTSFGASDAMHVGDRSWVLGLAMDI